MQTIVFHVVHDRVFGTRVANDCGLLPIENLAGISVLGTVAPVWLFGVPLRRAILNGNCAHAVPDKWKGSGPIGLSTTIKLTKINCPINLFDSICF